MLDIVRHQSVFNPHELEENVHVIGCGATGSRIVAELARLGIRTIHAWDDDKVEKHNIANQVYNQLCVGDFKVDAINMLTDIIIFDEKEIDMIDDNFKSITTHNEKVTNQALTGIVFLLIDTMASRKEIWENCIKFKPYVKLMIETRMGADSLRIYTINPLNFEQVAFWEGTLCDDEEAVVSACGANTTVGATAAVISGLAVWELIKYQRGESSGSEIIMGLRPDPIMLQNKL